MCESPNHRMIDCKSGTVNRLFLKNFINDPKMKINYTLAWGVVEGEVHQINVTKFRFSYFKKPKSKIAYIKNCSGKDEKQENSSKHKDTHQCFFCKSNSHLLKLCELYKLKKSKRKNRTPDINK